MIAGSVAVLILVLSSLPTQNSKLRKTGGDPPNSPTAGIQKNADNEKRGTQDSPFVVEESRSQRDDEAADAERKEQGQSSLQHWNIILAGVIAFAGIFQAVFVGFQVHINRAQMRSYRQSERAWLAVTIDSTPLADVMKPHEKSEKWLLGIQIRIQNIGKTQAAIVRSNVSFFSAETENPKPKDNFLVPKLPPVPDYTPRASESPIRPGTRFLPRQRSAIGIAIRRSFLLGENDAWMKGEKCLCILGFLEYRDAFEDTHRSRFCYVYQAVTPLGFLKHEVTGESAMPPGFYPAGPTAYNESD